MVFPRDQAARYRTLSRCHALNREKSVSHAGLPARWSKLLTFAKVGQLELQLAAMKQFGQPDLLSSGGVLPSHDRNISIRLICNHLPAAGQAGQYSGFGSAL
jgi:hypothetical protein